MIRDKWTLAGWRKLAKSKRLAGNRRIQLVDRLASYDNVYRRDGDSAEFVPTPLNATKQVKMLLRRIWKDADAKGRDRIKSRVLDRLSFIRGHNVPGFFRTQDPTATERELDLTNIDDVRIYLAQQKKLKEGAANGN